MSRCRNCNIEVLDVTECCPLCRSVLEQKEELENMYPDAVRTTRKLVFVSRLVLLAALLAESVLIWGDFNFDTSINWSVLVGLVILYFYLVVRYAIIGKSGYKSKVFVLVLITVLGSIALDFSTGYRGWSVEYVISGGIIFVDIGILGMMFFNRRNWQCYMIWQIYMILCSFVPVILHQVGLERNMYLAFIPLELSTVIFLGTLIMGGSRARTELKRRFHI